MNIGEYHINLPLETLLRRWQQEGYSLTPDVYISLQKLLQVLDWEIINDKKELCSIIAPIIVTTQSEQELFHNIFYNWWETHVANPEEIPSIEPSKELKWNVKTAKIFLCCLLIGLVALALFLRWKIINQDPPPPPTNFSSKTWVSAGSPIKFTNHTVLDSNDINNDSKFIWDFGDGHSDSLNIHSEHTYDIPAYYDVKLTHQLGNQDSSFSKKIFVAPRGELNANFDKQLISGNRYSFRPKVKNKAWTYEWIWQDEVISHQSEFSHEFPHSSNEIDISLVVKWKIDTLKFYTVSTNQQFLLANILVRLPHMQPIKDARQGRAKWTFLPILGVFLASITFWLVLRAFFSNKNEPKNKETLEKADHSGKSPPWRIPFPNQEFLIAEIPDLYRLASLMRRRRAGKQGYLDIQSTIQATIKAGGFPQLHYKSRSRPGNYIALVDKTSSTDQQALLFEQLLKVLQKEEVPLEIFTFNEDPRYCFHPKYPEGVSLDKLQTLYSDHRLLIFGKGEYLLNRFEGKIKSWVGPTFAPWKERAILTPNAVYDWGYKEERLNDYFVLLPADMKGQLELVENFEYRKNLHSEYLETPGEKERFEDIKEKLIKERSEDPISTQDYNFRKLEDIQIFLEPQLFKWLAASALYPRPTWEITLAIGHALNIKSKEANGINVGNEAIVLEPTYDSLLKLTHIPWLKNGDLSETLRSKLLKFVDPQTEKIAREAILDLLESSETEVSSYANQEWEIQRIIQKAKLNPDDQELQNQLIWLYQKGLLDPTLSKEIRGVQENRKKRQHLITFLLPIFLLLGGVFIFLATDPPQFLQTRPKLLNGLDEARLVQIDYDSTIYYNNRGVDFVNEGMMVEAENDFIKAIAYQDSINELSFSAYINKHPIYNLQWIRYRKADSVYQEGSWKDARGRFLAISDTLEDYINNESGPLNALDKNIDSLYLNALHGLGLTYTEEDKWVLAHVYQEKILEFDSSYFDKFELSLRTENDLYGRIEWDLNDLIAQTESGKAKTSYVNEIISKYSIDKDANIKTFRENEDLSVGMSIRLYLTTFILNGNTVKGLKLENVNIPRDNLSAEVANISGLTVSEFFNKNPEGGLGSQEEAPPINLDPTGTTNNDLTTTRGGVSPIDEEANSNPTVARIDLPNWLNQAKADFDAGKFQQALEKYKQILQRHPQNSSALNGKNQTEKAISEVSRWLNSAKQFEGNKVWIGATSEYKKILNKYPLHEEALDGYRNVIRDSLVKYAAIYERQQSWQQALEKYDRMLFIDPNDRIAKRKFEEVSLKLAREAENQNKFDLGIKTYSTLLNKNMASIEAKNGLISIASKASSQNNIQVSKEAYKQVLLNFPGDTKAINELGNLIEIDGDFDYRPFTLGQRYISMLATLGFQFEMSGNEGEAYEVFKTLIDAKPQIIHRDLTRFEGYEIVLRQDSKDQNAINGLAQLLKENKGLTLQTLFKGKNAELYEVNDYELLFDMAAVYKDNRGKDIAKEIYRFIERATPKQTVKRKASNLRKGL